MERPFDYPGSQPATRSHTFTLPDYWAAALINGNFEPYEQGEAEAIRAFLKEEGARLLFVTQEEEPQSGFLWKHDASHLWPFGSMCEEFIFVSSL